MTQPNDPNITAQHLAQDPRGKHSVHDYEFFLTNGAGRAFTIDETLGDSIRWFDTFVEIIISAKPSRTNPDFKVPGEDFKINLSHVVLTAHRTRMVANNPAVKDPIFAQMDPSQFIHPDPAQL